MCFDNLLWLQVLYFYLADWSCAGEPWTPCKTSDTFFQSQTLCSISWVLHVFSFVRIHECFDLTAAGKKKRGPEPVWASISDVDWEWCPLNKHMQSVYTWQNVTVACRLSVALAPAVFLSQQQSGEHFKNKSNLLKRTVDKRRHFKLDSLHVLNLD